MEDATQVARAFAESFPSVYLRFHRRDDKEPALSPSARGTLTHLALAGPSTVGELCHHLGRSQSVVSGLVAGLEQRGLLERQVDQDDRRRRRVWLTFEGQRFLAQEREILSVDLLSDAVAHMTPSERAALLTGIEALLRADDQPRANRALPTHRRPMRRDGHD